MGEGTQLELYTSSSTFSNNNILGSVAIDSSVTLDDTTFENNVLSDSVYEALSEKIEELAENNGRVDDAVAQIGDAKYLSLKDAVAAAQDGDTVTLLEDATGCGIVVLSGSNFTIDFGGHTYTVNELSLIHISEPTRHLRSRMPSSA